MICNLVACEVEVPAMPRRPHHACRQLPRRGKRDHLAVTCQEQHRRPDWFLEDREPGQCCAVSSKARNVHRWQHGLTVHAECFVAEDQGQVGGKRLFWVFSIFEVPGPP